MNKYYITIQMAVSDNKVIVKYNNMHDSFLLPS